MSAPWAKLVVSCPGVVRHGEGKETGGASRPRVGRRRIRPDSRLTSVTTAGIPGLPQVTLSFGDNVFDKRIGVAVDPDGQGPQVAAQQGTIYDGLNPYADFDGQGNVTERYLYGPAVGMIMARLGGEGDIVWYLGDHLGTVRDLADTSGQVIYHIA